MEQITLNLTIAQLQELHIILAVRLIDLEKDSKNKNAIIAGIVKRQLSRTMPIFHQVEKIVINHHLMA